MFAEWNRMGITAFFPLKIIWLLDLTVGQFILMSRKSHIKTDFILIVSLLQVATLGAYTIKSSVIFPLANVSYSVLFITGTPVIPQ